MYINKEKKNVAAYMYICTIVKGYNNYCSPEAVQIKALRLMIHPVPGRSTMHFLPHVSTNIGLPGDMHILQETHLANEPLRLHQRGERQAEQLWSLVE